MNSAETGAQDHVDWQYGDDTELEFANRSPMEEVESESILSKKFKGSMLSSRGRQSEDIGKRSPTKGPSGLRNSQSIVTQLFEPKMERKLSGH